MSLQKVFQNLRCRLIGYLGGGFKHFLFPSLFGADSHFDYCDILQMGWFNHQLDVDCQPIPIGGSRTTTQRVEDQDVRWALMESMHDTSG